MSMVFRFYWWSFIISISLLTNVKFKIIIINIFSPLGYMLKRPLAFPNRRSDFQAALNLTRYRNIHTDIV
jgi:hypothetical protein